MSLDSEYSNELMDEIKELLAQPEKEKEVYAKGYEDAMKQLIYEAYESGRKTVLSSPLSDEEIFSIGYKAGFAIDTIERDLAFDYGFLDEDGGVDNEPYFKLVRAIEKAHGITGGEE